MADGTIDKKAQNFIEKMKKERGLYVPAPMVYLASKDLPFVEAYDNLYNASLQDGKALPAKYRELVCIGILAHRGFEDICVSHIRRALRLGATKQEILDSIETMIIPGGTPTFGVALNAFIKVEEEEEKAKKVE